MKRILRLIVSVIALTSVAARAEDPVYFADANLKAAVEQALGISDPTPTDMLALTELTATYKAIANLTGIEYATNLTDLNLRGNQIKNLSPLSGLTNLTKLCLHKNLIVNISALSGLTNLTELDLNLNTGIRNIGPLSGLANLTSLEVNNNRVSDISPVSGLTNLTNLGLHNNEISDISALSGLTNLNRLVIGGNQISNISVLSGLTNLTRLSLSENLISNISPLSGLVNLEDIDIIYNQISDISHVSGLTNLRRLYLSHNNISDISALSALANLVDLGLPNNQISDISALAALTNLTTLNLCSNPLNSQAYSTYLPLIIANNPGIDLCYDPENPDTDPPSPDPMTWATEPYQTNASSIAMVATTATDPTTPIHYYFSFYHSPTGGAGGTSSGWQSSASYTDSGLSTNHQYGYKVRARDGNNNMTSYSAVSYDYTDIETPSGIAFGTITLTSIQAKSANTSSGLTRANSGLILYNITTVADSGWKQDNNLWTCDSLSANTQYGFRAKARNGDGDETDYCSTAYTYTLASTPQAGAFSNVTCDSIQANWTANANPAGTEYLCENITNGANSGWTANTYWTDIGLGCGTSYSYRVKARNGDGLETEWTNLGLQSTDLCRRTLTISSTNGGSVTVPGEGPFEYEDGAVVPIQATPETNYHFVNWTGTAVDAAKVVDPNDAGTAVTVDADYDLQANFAIDLRILTVSSTRGGSVSVPGEGLFQYPHASALLVQATVEPGYYFVNWIGTAVEAGKVLDPNAVTTMVTVDADYTLKASFVRIFIYVNDDALADPAPKDPAVSDPAEDGTPEHPFDAIQEAIDVSVDGVTVVVLAGTYYENINFAGKNIILTSIGPDDPNIVENTILSGNATDSVVTFGGGQEPNCVLAGFTITDGNAVYGGGVDCNNSSPTIFNCIVTGNSAVYGGAVFSSYGRSSLINCAFSANYADYGGAIASWNDVGLRLTNCTLSQNSAVHGGAVYCWDSNATIANCILWDNSPQEAYVGAGVPQVITYSDVRGGWSGDGNIDADPSFVQPGYWDANGTPENPDDDFWVAGDYHLLTDSPCIDTGDPSYVADANAIDLDGNPRVIGGYIDMGAYEYAYGELSDLNDDGIVNFRDYAILVYHWLDDACSEPDSCEGSDIDRSGRVDFGDLAIFCENWLWQASWHSQ